MNNKKFMACGQQKRGKLMNLQLNYSVSQFPLWFINATVKIILFIFKNRISSLIVKPLMYVT